MVLMVGGRVVPDGSSNYTAIVTTAVAVDPPAGNEDDDDDDSSVVDVEAQVIDEEEEDVTPTKVVQDKEFSNYIENLPEKILGDEEEGSSSPAANNKKPAAKAMPGERASKPARTSLEKDAKWMEMVDKLKEFKRLNGHCNVPYHRPPMLTAFQSWCHSQRRLYKTGRLQPHRQAIMEAVGFLWSAPKGKKFGDSAGVPKKVAWNARFEQLQAYKAKHGTSNVDKEALDMLEMQLSWWGFTQREKKHLGTLTGEHVQKLESIGFDWTLPLTTKGKPHTPSSAQKRPAAGESVAASPAKRTKTAPPPPPADEAEWKEMCGKLQTLKKAHKWKTLPAEIPNDPVLTQWVKVQRQRLDSRESLESRDLSLGRVAQLHKLGFLPARTFLQMADDTEWQDMYSKLRNIKGNDTWLPKSFPENKALDRWVNKQKTLLARQELPRDRMEKLLRLGFVLPAGVTMHTYKPKTPVKKRRGRPPKNQQALPMAAAAPHQPGLSKFQILQRDVTTRMEEVKTMRQQGYQELGAKLEKQAEDLIILGSKAKKQGQQILDMMELIKDAIATQTQQEQQQEVYQGRLRQKEEAALQVEQQRQREAQELLRQQEEQERQRRQAEQQRQVELYRRHGLII